MKSTAVTEFAMPIAFLIEKNCSKSLICYSSAPGATSFLYDYMISYIYQSPCFFTFNLFVKFYMDFLVHSFEFILINFLIYLLSLRQMLKLVNILSNVIVEE